MKFRLLGAYDRVTGSCMHFKDEVTGLQFLVDCGQIQGEREDSDWNRGSFPFDAREQAFVLLTHAHADHCGNLPYLCAAGFLGDVVCTQETKELATVILNDAAKFKGAAYSRGLHAIRWRVLGPQNGAVFGPFHHVAKDVFVKAYPNGHLLGSVSLVLKFGPRDRQTTFTITGDLGPDGNNEATQLLNKPRTVMPPSDYLVSEATYGDIVRHDRQSGRQERVAALVDLVRRMRTGEIERLIICTFAQGRAQEILSELCLLHQSHPALVAGIPVVLDSGLAVNINGVYAAHLGAMEMTPRGPRPRWVPRTTYEAFGLDPGIPADVYRMNEVIHAVLGLTTETPTMPELAGWTRTLRVAQPGVSWGGVAGPGIVVAGGGMLDGGTANRYLESLYVDDKTTFVLTGYQAPGTNGHVLQTLADIAPDARAGFHEALNLGRGIGMVPAERVRAGVTRLPGMSGHADQSGLLESLFLKCDGRVRALAPTIFLQHGRPAAQLALADGIDTKARRLGVASPKVVLTRTPGFFFDLDTNDWAASDLTREQALELRVAVLEDENRRLRRRAA